MKRLFREAFFTYTANNSLPPAAHLTFARDLKLLNQIFEELGNAQIVNHAPIENVITEGGTNAMATYRDPARVFAPLEIIERLLEIRLDAGHAPVLYVRTADDIATYLDAYGFDVYQFEDTDTVFQFGKYRAVLAPGGDRAHESLSAH